MAKKKTAAKSVAKPSIGGTAPKYPYTTRPSALRKFLKLVPEKPRPAKVNGVHLQSWGIGDTNALTMIRVLKRLGLVSATGEPTQDYDSFMRPDTGPTMLGRKLREIYGEIFAASKAPHKEDDGNLRRLFNIHTGGSEAVIQNQLQTFKTLSEFAAFTDDATVHAGSPKPRDGEGAGRNVDAIGDGRPPAIHIDLHIHLPPDKSSREYQAMFEDIGRYLMGRAPESEGA